MSVNRQVGHHMFHGVLLAAALLVTRPACAFQDGNRAGGKHSSPNKTTEKRAKGETEKKKTEPSVLRGANPLTIEVDIRPDDVSKIRAAMVGRLSKANSVRLTLKDLTPPESPDTTILVFLNHPTPRKASSRDPHLAGAVAFAHRENRKPQTFHLSLNRTLQRIPKQDRLADGGSVRVTLVAVPLRQSDDISGLRIPIRQVGIAVH